MIHQHTCPICGTPIDAAEQIAALRARLAALEAVPAFVPSPTPSNVTPLSAARKTRLASKPDYRTAAEIWAAGEVLRRPKKSEYRKGESKPVLVVFADGETMRVTTYLDGQAGLNAAGQFARTIRQAAPAEPHEYPVGLLYAHIAKRLGCEISEPEPGEWTWTGPDAQPGYTSRWLGAVVHDMVEAHGLTVSDAMRDAQFDCPEWLAATRRPGQWVRDAGGTWRLLDIRPCPDIAQIGYMEDDNLMAAE